jgi:mono/diheme cytochrome c family protein
MSRYFTLVVVTLAAIGVAGGAVAQVSTVTPNVKIVRVAPTVTATLDGAELYDAYCEVCHGDDLRGHGVARHFTAVPPTDLTVSGLDHHTVSERESHLEKAIRSSHVHTTRGSALDMPDWVATFQSMPPYGNASVRARLASLVHYMASYTDAAADNGGTPVIPPGPTAPLSSLTPNVKIIRVAPTVTSTTDGAELYDAYCAACHGPDLRGHGPAWRFTTASPTDLTTCGLEHHTVSEREDHLQKAIRSIHVHTTNGSALDMPDWAAIFRSMTPYGNTSENQRLASLAHYIALQQTAVK